jgi:hypothetical protein
MCLVVGVHLPFARRAEFDVATRPSPDDRMLVLVQPDRRWWLARRLGPPDECTAELALDESGCGCGFLSDQATFDSSVWNMKPDARNRLANALERFVGSIPGEVYVSAIWAGDRVKEERSLALSELVDLTRRGQLGTHTRYRIPRFA